MFRLLLAVVLAILSLVGSGCTVIPPDLARNTTSVTLETKMPLQKIKRSILQHYILAYCWVATEPDAFERVRIDVVVENGAGTHSSTITYPTEPPTTPVSLGCYGEGVSYRIFPGGLHWRPESSQLTMLTGRIVRADKFYFVTINDSMEIQQVETIWQHREFFIEPGSLAWSPDGALIATDANAADTHFGEDIWLYDPDTNRAKQLTHTSGIASYVGTPSWSPSGEYVAFTNTHPRSGVTIIRIKDLQTSEISNLNSELIGWPFTPGGSLSFSDGGFFVDSGKFMNEVMQTYVTQQSRPEWVNDDLHIIFVSPSSDERVTLFLMDMNDMSFQDLLPDIDGIMGLPRLSPDGHTLAFVRYPGWSQRDHVEIAVLDLSSGDILSLAVLPAPESGDELYVSGMDWTPDGKYLAFSSNHGGESDIYVISADGQSWVNLTAERRGDALNPVWRP